MMPFGLRFLMLVFALMASTNAVWSEYWEVRVVAVDADADGADEILNSRTLFLASSNLFTPTILVGVFYLSSMDFFQKNAFFLHISEKSCNFAAEL